MDDPRRALDESLQGLRSLSHAQAEAAGEPTVELVVWNEPEIRVKVYTKPVRGLPWDRDVQLTYFWASVTVAGRTYEPNTPWEHHPRDAMSSALRWWCEEIVTGLPFSRDVFPTLRPARGKYSSENYRNCWVLEEE